MRATDARIVLRNKRDFITESGPAHGLLRGRTTRAFDVSSTSMFAPWRELARRFGVRSVRVVPISDGGDGRGLLAPYSTREKYFDGAGIGVFDVPEAMATALRRRCADAGHAKRSQPRGGRAPRCMNPARRMGAE